MDAQEHATLSEAELLAFVHNPVPASILSRYSELIERRQAETLTPDEHRELLQLTDQIELHNVERLEFLTTLARMRGVSLHRLISDLDLKPSHIDE